MRIDEFAAVPDGSLDAHDLRRFLLVGFDLVPVVSVPQLIFSAPTGQRVFAPEGARRVFSAGNTRDTFGA